MKKTLLRWLKFSAVGWLGVGVQLFVLSLLAGQLGLHYLAATVLAVESAILHNFFWHERWTWGDRTLRDRAGRVQRLLRFNLTSGSVSILGNVVFMSVFVGRLGFHYLVGNLASIASCAILNFLISDRVVFLEGGNGDRYSFLARAAISRKKTVPVPISPISPGGSPDRLRIL